MTLIAGATNYRYLMLRDLNGSLKTGEAANFTYKAANEDGNITGIVTFAEVDAVNHPGLYKATISLSSYATAKSWSFKITNSTTGFAFTLNESADTSAADTTLSRKALLNRLELDPANDQMKLYDDDDSLLKTFTIKDKTGASISTGVGAGVPARRAKGT